MDNLYWHCDYCKVSNETTFLLRRKNDTVAICNQCYYKKYATKKEKIIFKIFGRFTLLNKN